MKRFPPPHLPENRLSVFLLKAHQYITPCPLKQHTEGEKKKDRENVILNIAPSSFLKCDLCLRPYSVVLIVLCLVILGLFICRQADSTFSEV